MKVDEFKKQWKNRRGYNDKDFKNIRKINLNGVSICANKYYIENFTTYDKIYFYLNDIYVGGTYVDMIWNVRGGKKYV